MLAWLRDLIARGDLVETGHDGKGGLCWINPRCGPVHDAHLREQSMTDYYIVAVDTNGDVLATKATVLSRRGLCINVQTSYVDSSAFGFENQGDDATAKWESARDALAAVMPSDDEEV